MDNLPKPTFSGEAMLAGWSETHNGGAKVTFWLADPSELDAFRSMTVAKGKTAGQRLAMVLVEIADDEQPVAENAPAIDAKDAVKGGKLAKLAGILCTDPEFQQWVVERFPEQNAHVLKDALPEDRAASIIRGVCSVRSRAELDHYAPAAATFHAAIRKPWISSAVTR